MTDSIKNAIVKVNENIYDYKLKELAGDLYSIMDNMNSWTKKAADADGSLMNLVFKAILKAMERRDYLLVADTLLFELLPIVEANEKV